MRELVKVISLLFLSLTGACAMAAESEGDKLWQANYDARKKYFESTVGAFPQDILKMLNMSGVWPGGGLFVLPAQRLGKEISAYTTFGFTNVDMPTTLRMKDFDLQAEGGRATKAEGTLERKEPAPKRPGAAGYGYEILVITEKNQEWPLTFLQWAVNAEIGNDVGLLARVEKYDGLTVERIAAGPSGPINVLIAKARAPLPTGTQLPAGRIDVLVATAITDEEMQWSMSNGRAALLRKLQDSGVGQVSILNRKSVVH